MHTHDLIQCLLQPEQSFIQLLNRLVKHNNCCFGYFSFHQSQPSGQSWRQTCETVAPGNIYLCRGRGVLEDSIDRTGCNKNSHGNPSHLLSCPDISQ